MKKDYLPLWIENRTFKLEWGAQGPMEHLVDLKWTYYFQFGEDGPSAGVYNIPEDMKGVVERRVQRANPGDFLSIVADIPGARYAYEGAILEKIDE